MTVEGQTRGETASVAAACCRANGNGKTWSMNERFFFQAEDGIRDYDVTGVQTCALPICVGLVEDHRLGCELVQKGRRVALVTHEADVVRAERVQGDQDDRGQAVGVGGL